MRDARCWKILHWMVRGKTNAQIAEILGMSTFQVNHLVERIFDAYKAPNRVAAVMTALARGDVSRDAAFKDFAWKAITKAPLRDGSAAIHCSQGLGSASTTRAGEKTTMRHTNGPTRKAIESGR